MNTLMNITILIYLEKLTICNACKMKGMNLFNLPAIQEIQYIRILE